MYVIYFFDNRSILFSDWRSWKTTRQPNLPVVFCVHSDMVAVYFVLSQVIGWEERLWSGLFCVVWHVEPQLHHSVKLCCTACVNRRCWKNCRSCKRLCHKNHSSTSSWQRSGSCLCTLLTYCRLTFCFISLVRTEISDYNQPCGPSQPLRDRKWVPGYQWFGITLAICHRLTFLCYVGSGTGNW